MPSEDIAVRLADALDAEDGDRRLLEIARRLGRTEAADLRVEPDGASVPARIPSPDLQSPDVDAAWRPGGCFRPGAPALRKQPRRRVGFVAAIDGP